LSSITSFSRYFAWLLLFATTQSSALLAQDVPVNKVLPLLEQDKPIFGQFVNYLGVGSDRESAIGHASNRDFDFVVYDLEQVPFDVPRLSEYLQWLLDRRAIADGGATATKTVFVRMPINTREGNEWVIKNVLDTGVHGLVFPHTETVELVLHVIQAMRYPQAPDDPDCEPEGIRGYSPRLAARYWRLSSSDGRSDDDRGRLWTLMSVRDEAQAGDATTIPLERDASRRRLSYVTSASTGSSVDRAVAR